MESERAVHNPGQLRETNDRCLIFEALLAFQREKELSHGGVAQLGEHLLCKQGVIGSNPFISTNAGS